MVVYAGVSGFVAGGGTSSGVDGGEVGKGELRAAGLNPCESMKGKVGDLCGRSPRVHHRLWPECLRVHLRPGHRSYQKARGLEGETVSRISSTRYLELVCAEGSVLSKQANAWTAMAWFLAEMG